MDKRKEDWQHKRTWMFINFTIGAFTFGLSLTAYYPTEFYYFKDFIKVKQPDVYYGLSWTFLCGSGVVTSLIASYYADYSKDIRHISLVTNALNVIGNIMYVLYYSPYLVLLGQILIGTSAARSVASVGELSRVYNANEITNKLSFLGLFTSLGSVLGPCTAYLSKFIDTHIGTWKLNIGNMIGVVMGGMFILQLLLTYLTLKNVSKEYTLKQPLSNRDLLNECMCLADQDYGNNPDLCAQRNENSFKKRYLSALTTMFKHKHIMFLFAMSFLTTYARGTLTLLQPIKASRYLSWAQTDLATFMMISTLAGGVPTAIILSFLSKCVNDFFLFLFIQIGLLVALVLMALLPLSEGDYIASVVVIYVIGILCLTSSAGFQILSRSILAKFVPEDIQTTSEAIRNGLFEIAYMFSGLFIKLPSTYLTHSMLGMAVIISGLLAWYISEDSVFRNIDVFHVKNSNKMVKVDNCKDFCKGRKLREKRAEESKSSGSLHIGLDKRNDNAVDFLIQNSKDQGKNL